MASSRPCSSGLPRRRLSRRTAGKFPSVASLEKALRSTFAYPGRARNNCGGDFCAYCSAIQNRQSQIENCLALWCNGNTAPFGGVILGSNPSGAATLLNDDLP